MRLICGSLYGARSPVRTFSEMFYADITLEGDARLSVPAEHEERAAYVVTGGIGGKNSRQTYALSRIRPRCVRGLLSHNDSDPLHFAPHAWYRRLRHIPQHPPPARRAARRSTA
jgi:redox-sensitive bicupin YhaK (pirin superfamily)